MISRIFEAGSIRIVTSDHVISHLYNGKLHRDDGPAIIKKSGYEAWYKHGKLHRDNGPAVYNNNNTGLRIWYKNGKIHRADGPAWISDHSHAWLVDGIYKTTPQEFQIAARLSDEDMLALLLKWKF